MIFKAAGNILLDATQLAHNGEWSADISHPALVCADTGPVCTQSNIWEGFVLGFWRELWAQCWLVVNWLEMGDSILTSVLNILEFGAMYTSTRWDMAAEKHLHCSVLVLFSFCSEHGNQLERIVDF